MRLTLSLTSKQTRHNEKFLYKNKTFVSLKLHVCSNEHKKEYLNFISFILLCDHFVHHRQRFIKRKSL